MGVTVLKLRRVAYETFKLIVIAGAALTLLSSTADADNYVRIVRVCDYVESQPLHRAFVFKLWGQIFYSDGPMFCLDLQDSDIDGSKRLTIELDFLNQKIPGFNF